ncbi:hypothetical protein MMC12_000287 [Toensbergia leucococca]|nr:hypothetical protein [Toensbergia leucococca]
MPRANLPPTPASSTDILGKDDSRLSFLETSFTLPPPAIASAAINRSSSTSVKSAEDSTNHPASPNSPIAVSSSQAHKWHSNTQQRQPPTAGSDFSLPPPPTRSRKIIQMKPGQQTTQSSTHSTKQTAKESNKRPAPASSTTSASVTKKKHPSSTSMAGRKIARKTAHSLIERRRRSKMNEEFGVLKDMIPACKDEEMHKLAILQASIDYLRYLEQCVTDLKAANSALPTPKIPASQAPKRRHTPPIQDSDSNATSSSASDHEMENPSPTTSPQTRPSNPQAPTPCSIIASPSLGPHNNNQNRPSHTPSLSTLPSPAFGSHHQHHYQAFRPHQYTHSASTSPALLPSAMRDSDHEATAALLMLNQERRNTRTGSSVGRGMSVKDLLGP